MRKTSIKTAAGLIWSSARRFGIKKRLRPRVQLKCHPKPDGAIAGREVFHLHNIEIYPESRSVRRKNQLVELAPKEFDLLLELIRQKGAVVSRMFPMKKVWGHASEIVSRTVDTHIAELRCKLEDDASQPKLILTVRTPDIA